MTVDAEIILEFSRKLVKFHPGWDSTLLWPLVQALLKSSIHIKVQGHNPAGFSVLPPGQKTAFTKANGSPVGISVPPQSSTDNKNVKSHLLHKSTDHLETQQLIQQLTVRWKLISRHECWGHTVYFCNFRSTYFLKPLIIFNQSP